MLQSLLFTLTSFRHNIQELTENEKLLPCVSFISKIQLPLELMFCSSINQAYSLISQTTSRLLQSELLVSEGIRKQLTTRITSQILHTSICLTNDLGREATNSIPQKRQEEPITSSTKLNLDFQNTPYCIRIPLSSYLHSSSLLNARWNNHLNAPLCLNSAAAIASATPISNYLPITTAF